MSAYLGTEDVRLVHGTETAVLPLEYGKARDLDRLVLPQLSAVTARASIEVPSNLKNVEVETTSAADFNEILEEVNHGRLRSEGRPGTAVDPAENAHRPPRARSRDETRRER